MNGALELQRRGKNPCVSISELAFQQRFKLEFIIPETYIAKYSCCIFFNEGKQSSLLELSALEITNNSMTFCVIGFTVPSIDCAEAAHRAVFALLDDASLA